MRSDASPTLRSYRTQRLRSGYLRARAILTDLGETAHNISCWTTAVPRPFLAPATAGYTRADHLMFVAHRYGAGVRGGITALYRGSNTCKFPQGDFSRCQIATV